MKPDDKRFKKVRTEMNTSDMAVGQVSDIILCDGEINTGGNVIEPVDKPINSSYMDELAFMEEELIITVAETDDQNAENPVSLGCNGVFKYIFRGQPTKLKRKFVDCLIVKSGRITTPKVKNGAGEDAFAIKQTSAHKYPFSVLVEPNQKRGQEWLLRRMAEQM